MNVLDYLISIIWLSPLFYLLLLVFGEYFYKKRKSELIKRTEDIKTSIDKIIFQIPTVGNYRSVNRIFEIVKSYNLPMPVETWAVVETDDAHKADYVCDRTVIVPTDFECEDLYKARALEYSRRLRKEMVTKGELTPDYILLQGDDDAVPSLGFIQESLSVRADISIGEITPKVEGVLSTILDYERCVACGIFCNFFTNLGQPLWAHGEGTVMSSKVDQEVSYDVSSFNPKTNQKLALSEDAFYFHKAACLGYNIFNSEEKVTILPPLDLNDALKQRRRWLWGQLRILNQKLLPLSNRVRLAVVGFSGLWLYSVAILGLPLAYFHVINIPSILYPLTGISLFIWFAMRFYIIGKFMGWKQGFIGAALSYITVTMNFFINIIGILQGDPKKFVVIRKE